MRLGMEDQVREKRFNFAGGETNWLGPSLSPKLAEQVDAQWHKWDGCRIGETWHNFLVHFHYDHGITGACGLLPEPQFLNSFGTDSPGLARWFSSEPRERERNGTV